MNVQIAATWTKRHPAGSDTDRPFAPCEALYSGIAAELIVAGRSVQLPSRGLDTTEFLVPRCCRRGCRVGGLPPRQGLASRIACESPAHDCRPDPHFHETPRPCREQRQRGRAYQETRA